MKHLVGSIVRVLIDYMDYVPLCAKLKSALEVQREWPEIRKILGKNKYFTYNFKNKNVHKNFLNVFDIFSASPLYLELSREFVKIMFNISLM